MKTFCFQPAELPGYLPACQLALKKKKKEGLGGRRGKGRAESRLGSV